MFSITRNVAVTNYNSQKKKINTNIALFSHYFFCVTNAPEMLKIDTGTGVKHEISVLLQFFNAKFQHNFLVQLQVGTFLVFH